MPVRDFTQLENVRNLRTGGGKIHFHRLEGGKASETHFRFRRIPIIDTSAGIQASNICRMSCIIQRGVI